MKIGFILECGPKGPDLHVCKHLATRILEEANLKPDFSFTTLGNKPDLLQQCGDAASLHLSQGCERVLIVWDLYPAWRERGQKPCRHEDRQQIFAALEAANVDRNHVALICIQEELEAWLLADGDALTAFLRKFNSHVEKVSHNKNPERIGFNPKTALNDRMQKQTGQK